MKLHFISDEKPDNERPKLGLGYLASYLKKYAPKTNLSISFEGDDYLADIERIKPDIIGFSAMTPTFNNQIEKAKKIKKITSAPLIIGGNHISLVPQDLPTWFEAGIVSEGEEVLRRVVENYGKTGRVRDKKIPALVWREKEKLIITGEALLVEPIDNIPFPDWDFLKVGKSGPGHIITSRGCPFRCRFCEAGKFWKKYRSHSAAYVVSEIEEIYRRYGRDELVIMDDLFFLDKERIKEIGERLESRGLTKKMRFEVIGRADLFNEEIAGLLKKMSVFAISFGMESGSEKILQYLKRQTVTLEQIRKAVAVCKKYNLQVLGGFMVGSPEETVSDIEETIDFIKELDLDQVGINVTTPLPGTELWEKAKEKGLVKNETWDERLWAMKDVTAENINKKLLLTDIPRPVFLKLLNKLNSLEDWTHRRRRNEQLFRLFIGKPNPVNFSKFILHSLKRPAEAWYNLRKGKLLKWLKSPR
ncbi:MAG: radical SAM protein [bacterium]|nr:radical SAM protein [bacterium]